MTGQVIYLERRNGQWRLRLCRPERLPDGKAVPGLANVALRWSGVGGRTAP